MQWRIVGKYINQTFAAIRYKVNETTKYSLYNPLYNNDGLLPRRLWCDDQYHSFIRIKNKIKKAKSQPIKWINTWAKYINSDVDLVLHIDLWQSRQLAMHLCKQSDNRKTSDTSVSADHVNHEPEGSIDVMKICIYTGTQRVTVSQSVSRSSSQEIRRAANKCLGPWQTPVEKLLSRKQRCKALKIESQRGLRKDQYSSSPSVCGHDLSLALTANFRPFEERIIFL